MIKHSTPTQVWEALTQPSAIFVTAVCVGQSSHDFLLNNNTFKSAITDF